MATTVRDLRLTRAESIYVLMVAVLATIGFTAASAPVILLTASFSLPSSMFAVLAYYAAYGLLATVPGANPSSSTGSGSCAPNGDCTTSTTGDLAAWFAVTTEVIAILALVAAALLNVALLRLLNARRRARPRRR